MKTSAAPLLYLWLACTATLEAAPMREVIYPAPESPQDVRFNDLIDLLQGALNHTVATFGPYRMRPTQVAMNGLRLRHALEEGRDVTVIWTSTSEQKERDLLPIRIPLRKGLLGYRIALIARDRQAAIDAALTAGDLHGLTIGQGLGWGDVALYQANGFQVTTANYDSLFRMVGVHRFDLFPRGIGEAFKEYDARVGEEPNLAIEQHLLIEYRWPYYFFLNKKDTALARRIEEGLRMMMKDGSFDANFRKYYGADIARANLAQRKIVHLDNPLLPKATPLDDKSLWFDPTSGR